MNYACLPAGRNYEFELLEIYSGTTTTFRFFFTKDSETNNFRQAFGIGLAFFQNADSCKTCFGKRI
jgi:hypothetical protein